MVLFGDQDFLRECGSSAYEAGSPYDRQARVVTCSREDDLIRSSVKGSQKKPYRQTIKLIAKGSGIHVAGHCSCPVGHNCKHIAAALLHGLTIASHNRPNGRRRRRGSPPVPSVLLRPMSYTSDTWRRHLPRSPIFRPASWPGSTSSHVQPSQPEKTIRPISSND